MNYLDVQDIQDIFIMNKDLLHKSIFNRRFSDFQFYMDYSNDHLDNAEQYTIKTQYTSDKSISLFSILEKNKKYTTHNTEYLFDYLYKDLDEFNYQIKTNIYQFPCIFVPVMHNNDIKYILDKFHIKYDKIDFLIKKNEVITLFTNYKFIFLFNKNESNNIDIMHIVKFYVDKMHSINEIEQAKIKDIPEFNVKTSDFSEYLTPSKIYLKFDNNFYETLIKIYIEKYLDIHYKTFIKNVLNVLSIVNVDLTSDFYKDYIKYNKDIITFLLISICKKLDLKILYDMCLNFILTQFSCYFDKYKFNLKFGNQKDKLI